MEGIYLISEYSEYDFDEEEEYDIIVYNVLEKAYEVEYGHQK